MAYMLQIIALAESGLKVTKGDGTEIHIEPHVTVTVRMDEGEAQPTIEEVPAFGVDPGNPT